MLVVQTIQEAPKSGVGSDPGDQGHAGDEGGREERKRYTAQLQRRAQAHVTAELGVSGGEVEVDRRITMVVRHVRETTGARRVTILRPIPRGKRWHVSTVVEDGCFYYGLIAQESLVLPMAAYRRKGRVLLSEDRDRDPDLPDLSELGVRSYVAVPIVDGAQVIGVVEAVDVADVDGMDAYAESLEQAVALLATNIGAESRSSTWQPVESVPSHLSENAVFDLVLRPPVDVDDTMEITPTEWALLNQLNGERSIAQVAAIAGVTPQQVMSVAAKLLERGLIRSGRESRCRQ